MAFSVFFDTEFTTSKPNEQPYLISISCVAEDGREFYAELSDTWHIGLCSEFVVSMVLPLLEGGACRTTEQDLAVRLREWIESLGTEEVIMRTDAPAWDWPWVEELFYFYGTWPKSLRRWCGTICFEDESAVQRYEEGLENYWQQHMNRRHHALVDPRSLHYAWKCATA